MKKLFLVLLLIGFGTAASAQTAPKKPADVRATELTRKMMQEYELDEGSYLKLKALNTKHLTQLDQLQKTHASDQAALQQKTQEEKQAYLAALRQIFPGREIALNDVSYK